MGKGWWGGEGCGGEMGRGTRAKKMRSEDCRIVIECLVLLARGCVCANHGIATLALRCAPRCRCSNKANEAQNQRVRHTHVASMYGAPCLASDIYGPVLNAHSQNFSPCIAPVLNTLFSAWREIESPRCTQQTPTYRLCRAK